MANWNNPTLTSTYTDVLTELKNRDLSVAKMDYSADSNVPTDVVRYNTSDNSWERWNGSSWADLGIHALLAYLAENETVTGQWTFDAATTFDDTTLFNGNASFAADIVTTATEALLRSNTSDTDDDKSVALTGAGALAVTRGSAIRSNGNEHATRPGMLELYGGNVTGGDINFYIANASKALSIAYASGNTVSEYQVRQKAGTSSNYSALSGIFISDTLGNSGNTAGSSGVAIKSCAIPANTLATNGEKLCVKAFGAFSSSGSTNKRLRLRWAGVDIWDSGGLTIVTQQWWIEAMIIRSSSSNAACFLRYTNSAGAIVVTSINITTTFSNSNNLQVLGGGTLADDVTAYMLTADYIPLNPN
jgi:hypothetical protein